MVLTGSYSSHAHVIDMQRRINTTLEMQFLDKRGKILGTQRAYKGKRLTESYEVSLAKLGTPSSKDGSNQSIISS